MCRFDGRIVAFNSDKEVTMQRQAHFGKNITLVLWQRFSSCVCNLQIHEIVSQIRMEVCQGID
jgi:hypothetical protein